MSRLRPALPTLTTLLVLAFGLAGCGLVGDNGRIELTATYEDVGDLVTDAHVRAGDVPVGVVTDIELLDDFSAQVTMRVDEDTGLPADTEAVLARTGLLGERYIDLRPVGEGGSLEDGTHLEATRTVREFEDLVRSGDDTLSLVSADLLGAAVETGAVAFGGRGGLIGRFIEDVDSFVGRYEEGTDDLLHLIDSVDALTAGLAEDAEVNAESLAVLERASRVLEEEDDRLIDALSDLTDLAEVGERILEEHREEIQDSVRRLRILLAQLTRVDGALSDLLTWAPRHNIHVPNGVMLEEGSGDHMAQVWLDFIVCGVNDTPGDPSRACDPPNPGESAESDKHPRSEECFDDLEVCREETDREQAR
jgi:phospholipid/cholesterol/gamma-HCH transport system substrate-binding protein